MACRCRIKRSFTSKRSTIRQGVCKLLTERVFLYIHLLFFCFFFLSSFCLSSLQHLLRCLHNTCSVLTTCSSHVFCCVSSHQRPVAQYLLHTTCHTEFVTPALPHKRLLPPYRHRACKSRVLLCCGSAPQILSCPGVQGLAVSTERGQKPPPQPVVAVCPPNETRGHLHTKDGRPRAQTTLNTRTAISEERERETTISSGRLARSMLALALVH